MPDSRGIASQEIALESMEAALEAVRAAVAEFMSHTEL